MRVRRVATAAALAGVVATVVTGTATAAPADTWSPSLTTGDAVGVRVDGGVARPVAPDVGAASVGTLGLLTLPARTLDAPTDRVDAVVEGTADVDVRVRRDDGGWTEWTPAQPSAALSAAGRVVQARLVLDRSGDAAVRGLRLTAHPATRVAPAQDEPVRSYRVFATREGLVGGKTSNGHIITENDMFVALPSRRALSPRDTSDYSVKVCTTAGRCAFAPVWDVGPWNTRDDYWSPSGERENWGDLPQGTPQSQAAKESGHNGGKDQFGRTVLNPAGIDLADGLFRDALGLPTNDWVTVDYLWTGHSPLARVVARTDVRASPDPAAKIVGLAAEHAAVPVECTAGAGWLRIGDGQFLPAGAVPRPGHLPACR